MTFSQENPSKAENSGARINASGLTIAAVLLGGCALAAVLIPLGRSGHAQAQTAAQPRPQPQRAAPAQKPAEEVKPAPAAQGQQAAQQPETQPLAHARGASISTCIPALSELSRLTVDAPHAALSVWNRDGPNDHAFSSIVGLRYENQQAPRAVSVLTVAPNKSQKCDGATVQVQPSSLSCEVIAGNLTKQPKTVARDMNGVTLVQGDGPLRIALLPTAGSGCTIVGVATYFARP